MTMRRNIALYLASAALVSAVPAAAPAAEELSATPYRPTVSNPADLSVPGHLEVEAGFLRSRNDDPRRRDSLPVLFKYAFTENVGVLVGGEGYVKYYSDIDGNAKGAGDTSLTLKLRHEVNDKLGLGLEAGVKLPTAKDLIGSGKHDVILNGILSAGLGEAALDLNVGAQRIGAVNPGESRMAYTWAAALSHPIGEKWGIAGEFSGVTQRGVPSATQFLAAVSYSASKTVVLDAGMAWGLSKGATDRTVFAGITVLIK